METLTSRLPPVVIGAGTGPFSWLWIRSALDANVMFVKDLATTVLVFQCYCARYRPSVVRYVLLLSMLACNMLPRVVRSVGVDDPWMELAACAGVVGALAAATYVWKPANIR